MGIKLKKTLTSRQLASGLNLTANGPDLNIDSIEPLSEIKDGSLSFYVRSGELKAPQKALLICLENLVTSTPKLISPNPRLDFVRALNWINEAVGFEHDTSPPKIHPSVILGQNTFIGKGCEIQAGTHIGNNVVISDGTIIGKNCVIKSGAVIGENGFGFERDEHGVPLRMLHLGKILIGDRVEVGSITTICRGTLSDTIIENDVKIDDHVHVAHNCYIAAKTIVTACAELSGGVYVGEESWLAPNSSVLEKIKLAPKTFVGLGAVIIRNTETESTYVGNPAKKLEKKL